MSRAPEEDVLDRALLESMRLLPGRHGPSLLPELITVYLEQEPVRAAQLPAFAVRHEWDELARAAHTIAGSCSTFGAKALQASALALEASVRSGDRADVSSRIEAMQHQSRCVQAALKNLTVSIP